MTDPTNQNIDQAGKETNTADVSINYPLAHYPNNVIQSVPRRADDRVWESDKDKKQTKEAGEDKKLWRLTRHGDVSMTMTTKRKMGPEGKEGEREREENVEVRRNK